MRKISVSVDKLGRVTADSELLGYVVGAQSKEPWEEIINELLAETK